ncbi:MAG: hypothetical protein Q7S33_05630 [Nanoarchaeota archaeon]|nr:hypothetical protein [Nanoarchaeota archaeon]
MEKFKLKGTVIEELPEMEIEAENRDEAEEKYLALYQDNKIEGEGIEIVFDDECEEEEEEIIEL